jgi:valyl-tRNA synthetase
MTTTELGKQYDPSAIEPQITRRWLESRAFAALPDARERRYVIMMPLPNVTGALHMGHAIDNVLQDLLTRWHRMQGDNVLWQCGTDHAGIATQAVIEKRLLELEGKTRHDVGREELVRRIWAWKDQYQQRIVQQQQAMGCSCDWDRARFTMDAVCARAVRETFFRMFRDGLIFQGDRLVNWDCQLQTAVADDELYKGEVQGHFYHLRYPVLEPRPGEPTHVVVATTRPETMLGDTAVACHPDPRGALQKLLAAAAGEGAERRAELERRLRELAPALERIAAMARAGRQVRLPLAERPIPIILDEWAQPDLGSGCVKITPAHDPNDYEVWKRHRDQIAIRNVLNPDGTLNENAGRFAGSERFAARKLVVAELQAQGLIERIEDRVIEIDHSDRSRTIVEPYLSRQWFVRMGDVAGGIVLGRGTKHERRAAGLAQAAIDAADPAWRSPSGRQLAFHPDERYGRTYVQWLAEKRDWCISRQLWWGHRIPVWSGRLSPEKLLGLKGLLQQYAASKDLAAWVAAGDELLAPLDAMARIESGTLTAPEATPPGSGGITAGKREGELRVLLCCRDPQQEQRIAPLLRGAGFTEDPDVLDTWFSSALWPQSTLGWPEPATAAIDAGQTPLGAQGGRPSSLDYYYPGSCLVTDRNIITLWVVRMVVTGLYNLGDVPFTDVFVHATIQDGKGERMSKSKGNGIDPVDIIERYGADALRFVLCELQTGTQDIRIPVQAISPFGGHLVDLTTAKPGKHKGTFVDPENGKLFDVIGQMQEHGVPSAKTISERFEVGRNFCNKLWNATRFALMNLKAPPFEPRDSRALPVEDRWILSRLAAAVETVHGELVAYNPSAAIGAARDFFWNDFCDWYLELVKPRMRDAAQAPLAQQVLAATLDQVLRLLHPFVPFLTEALWEKLGAQAPRRGIDRELPQNPLLVTAAWPQPRPDWRDPALEADIGLMQGVVAGIRDVRARYTVPPNRKLAVVARANGAAAAVLERCQGLIASIAGAESFRIEAHAKKPVGAATAVVRDVDLHVLGVVDVGKERERFAKQEQQLAARIAGIEKKLGNEGFTSKAPPEVVAREKATLLELTAQLASVRGALREFGEA